MLHTHLWPDGATINQAGRLLVGGCDVVALAAQYGTPLYLLDEPTLRGACRAYRAAFAQHYSGTTRVHFASKALLNLAVAAMVAQEGLGLDVVSGSELAVARAAGVDLAQTHLHGNSKTRAELERALDWGIGHIVVDTLDELALLARLTNERERRQPILLRLGPEVDVATHDYVATGHAASKFGLPLDALDAAAAVLAAAPGLQLDGLHAHLGSALFDAAPFALAIARLLDVALLLRERHGLACSLLSPGGGLGVPYLPQEEPADLAAYAATIAQALTVGCAARNLPLPLLVVEPGRSIVARAGVALYEIVGRKRVAGQTPYIHVDGGMGDNPRPALYGARYHGLLANRAAEEPAEQVHVAGRFCESGDVLIRSLPLPAALPGDLLAVPVAGAYTLSMASTYNLVPRPALLLVGNGAARLIQRRETDDDLLRRDLPL